MIKKYLYWQKCKSGIPINRSSTKSTPTLPCKRRGKSGFTLAEVLITLGIIGVVAAMTLPTLVQNYKKQAYVNQLKKMISTLENGIRQASADEGVAINQTELFQNLLQGYCFDSSELQKRYDIISKYFKVIGKDATNPDDFAFWGSIKLLDGSMIDYRPAEGTSIDVNGNKGPNKWNRDRFRVIFDDDGIAHDYDDCDLMNQREDKISACGAIVTIPAGACGLCEEILKNNPNAESCYLYRIQRDGWQMKY